MSRLIIIVAAALAVLAAVFLFMPHSSGGGSDLWALTATDARIIGGYGNNFVYDGKNVRPLQGRALLKIDPKTKKGSFVAIVRTTKESGPIVMAKDEPLSGEIKLVWQTDAPGARYQEYVNLHGDSGNGTPIMPRIFNYLTGWAPVKLYVNGKLKYKLEAHFMFTEGSRRPDGTMRKNDGTIYSPKLKAESGFTDPTHTALHLVAHSMTPDPNNFPPQNVWVHLMFNQVTVEKAPPGPRPIPGYSR